MYSTILSTEMGGGPLLQPGSTTCPGCPSLFEAEKVGWTESPTIHNKTTTLGNRTPPHPRAHHPIIQPNTKPLDVPVAAHPPCSPQFHSCPNLIIQPQHLQVSCFHGMLNISCCNSCNVSKHPMLIFL